MPTRLQRLAAIVLSTLLLPAGPIALSNAQAQAVAAPSQIEREVWASSQQIGTVAAYQAYLTRFPDGFFAPLATAAMKKVGDSPNAAPSQVTNRPSSGGPPKAESSAPPFDPVKIAGPTDSSAITQQAGDVFYGPGPITVGWLGAKKQVLVPSGRWVLLAAEDGLSGHTPPIPLTTLVLARLEGSAVQSFLLARFNSKSGNSRSTWPEAQACQSNPSSATFAWRETSSGVTECVTSALRTPASAAAMLAHPFWKAPLQALAKAGGTVAKGSYLVTDMSYTGDLSNYMKLTRIDFNVSPTGANPASNVAGQAAAIDLSVAGRKQWAQAYAPLAALGYRKKLAEDELYAGSKPTAAVASLPD